MANCPITAKEKEVALALCKSAKGATANDLAKRLRVDARRARKILQGITEGRPAGLSAGKKCRTLVFKL